MELGHGYFDKRKRRYAQIYRKWNVFGKLRMGFGYPSKKW
jgi:hypothetical protein